MLIGELHRRLGYCYSLSHLRRLAHKGEIPGAKLKLGKKFRFRQSPQLESWIRRSIEARTRQKNRIGAQKQPKTQYTLEAGDTGIVSLLEIVRQFQRDYFNLSRRISRSYREEITKILQPVLRDLDLGRADRCDLNDPPHT
jgi:hypothetical protein